MIGQCISVEGTRVGANIRLTSTFDSPGRYSTIICADRPIITPRHKTRRGQTRLCGLRLTFHPAFGMQGVTGPVAPFTTTILLPADIYPDVGFAITQFTNPAQTETTTIAITPWTSPP